MVLSRQPLPTLDRTKYSPASGAAYGAYVLADTPGTWLLWWDYDRWKGLLPWTGLSGADVQGGHLGTLTTLSFLVAAAVGLAGVGRPHQAWLRHRSFVTPSLIILAGAAIGLWTFVTALRQTAPPRAPGPEPRPPRDSAASPSS